MQGRFIKLNYSNSNDFGGILFSDNIFQDLYLDGTLGEKKIDFIEYANKNETNEVSFTKKVMEESVKIKTIGGEWIYELLCFISLCDKIYINNKVGELDEVIEMKVDPPDTKDICLITCTFILKRIVWNLCNSNPLQILTCPVSTQDIQGTIVDNNPIYTTGNGSITTGGIVHVIAIGDYLCVFNSSGTIGIPADNKYYIIKRIDSPLLWEFIQPSIFSRFLDLNNLDIYSQANFYYVLKQNEISNGKYYPVTQFPTLISVSLIAGTLTITGECLDGYFIQAYHSTDGSTFTNIGNVINASNFNANGIILTHAMGHYWFKLALINCYYTVCYYSNVIEIMP
jgi:hypothetical protein